MVLTRKRSVSNSEAGTASISTPRAAKLKKHDESAASPTPRTTPKYVDAVGAPATITTTCRRKRRYTDSQVEAVGAGPYAPSTGTGSASDQDTAATPIKAPPTEGSVDKAGNSDAAGGKKIRVLLKDISTPATPARCTRSRRASEGEIDGHGTPGVGSAARSLSLAPSTPVRRSRRLSGSGVEEVLSQETPSMLSFSIARIIGVDKKSKEEATNKQSSLPVIKEDAEQQESENGGVASPRKDTTEMLVSEEEKEEPVPAVQIRNDGNEEKHASAVQDVSFSELGCVEFPVPAEKEEEPSEPGPLGKAAEREVKVPEGQMGDSNEGDVKSDVQKSPVEDAEEQSAIISEMEETKENQEPTSVVNDVESSNDKLGMRPEEEEQEEQNTDKTMSDCKELMTDDTIPADSEVKQEDMPETEVPKESCIAEETQETYSVPVDENFNKNVNGKCLSLLSQVVVGDKTTKVIPEMEKKIEQIRSIPKGRPISGRWWKAEKQRFRSINKDATGKKRWSKKMKIKQWHEDVQAKSAAIEAEKQKKKEDLRERQRVNKIRREENARKAEVVQVIKDPRKIKMMKRKQLQYIETRDTASLKQV